MSEQGERTIMGAFFVTDRAGKDGCWGRRGNELGEQGWGRGLSVVEGTGEYG